MSQDLNVAVCEMTSSDDVEANIKQILQLLSSLSNSNSFDLICFPENSLYFRLLGNKVPGLALDDHRLAPLRNWAKLNQCYLHLGSVPLLIDNKTYNASLLIDPGGTVTSPYQKIHLFDVDVEGQKRIRESDVFCGGKTPSVFEVKGWRIGSSICYDLRFAELYNQYGKAEVDLILVPSAFIVPTGRAHWEILLRARAIENQCYVLAAAQGGRHKSLAQADSNETRETYGHSMIIDPWGLILSEVLSPDSERVLTAVLNKSRIKSIRAQIPMSQHRKL
jgi:predicted amidohydrolase